MSDAEPNAHVVALIAKSLDELLTPSELAQVNDHLRTCVTCRIACDGLYEFDALLKRTTMAMPDEGFALRVLARIHAYETRRDRLQWLITLLLVFFGLLFAGAWGIANFVPLLDSVGSLLITLESVVPVWFNALLVVTASVGQGLLLIYALVALALTYVWTRVSGDFSPASI